MCGIWALLEYQPILNSKIINSYNNIKNRGPDSSLLHIDKNYIIGFHRLAINDLSVCGNQPFYLSSKDYNYILVINGEIYNYKELIKMYEININSTSDCAFVLPLFIKLNEDFKLLNNLLRGEYSMLILKQNKNNMELEYFISTDPLSVRPLFYYISNYKVGISSLLNGLSDYSNDVNRLNQGTCLYGITDFKYFHKYNLYKYHNYHLEYFNNNNDIHNKIVKTLIESIKIRLNSDRPLGCLLSGGLDSSLISAIASKELLKNGKILKTFSIGMKDGTDLKYARIVSKYINSDHTEYYFTAEDGLNVIDEVIKATETYDITTIRASVGQFILAKKISENTNIKVLLNGDGADECQMGYLYFYLFPNLSEAIKERNKLLDQIHLFDGLRVDRNISYHGLEARVPFLDKEFVDLYRKIHPNLLVPTKECMEKYLIRNAFETIIPNLLPKEILWRKKEAFSDGVSSNENSWFKILKTHFNNLISDQEFNNNNITYIKPFCKESFYYRKKFTELFGENYQIIPRYWMPNWTNTKDPSARTLNIYNQ